MPAADDRRASLRERLRDIIFEADTPAGKWFDILLIVAIVLSVLAVLLDSIASVRAAHGAWLHWVEWGFTIAFTIEYGLRLWCINEPRRYATSFYGVVDLLGILPTYLALLFAGGQYLLVVRILRVLRVFRVFRLSRYVGEADMLMEALRSSRRKITVFLFTVLASVVVFGALMYLIEGPERGFTSIPRSMYWAIVTLTTVGYGDISPQTPIGQALASLVMVFGYGIIAVPTGIFSLGLADAIQRRARENDNRACQTCAAEGHRRKAGFCWSCGTALFPPDDVKTS